MKMQKKVKNISIIGAGSWGTSVAKAIAETHPDINVRMWALEKSVSSSINRFHENKDYLPGVILPENITSSGNLRDAVADAGVVLIATPSKVVYETCQKLRKYLDSEVVIGYLSKGFCKINHDICTISQTIEKALPEQKNRVVAIYGPSHAEEVSNRFHTCLNIAGRSSYSRKVIRELLNGDYVECRETEDIIGTDVGATLKNPAAIAAGMISVLPFCGDNLAGALISEALKEMIRLGEALDANIDTIVDIAGLGDLVATALSDHSRNRRFGKDIARQIIEKGSTLSVRDRIFLKVRPSSVIEKMSKDLHYLAEGAYAIEPLIELAEEKNISIPVYRSLYEVLLNKKDPSLLIETIKNPEKFGEIYSNTKIQLTDKQKGLEKVKGNVFYDLIVSGTIDKFILAKEKGQPADFYNVDIVDGLKNSLIKLKNTHQDRLFKKEEKLISKINNNNYKKIISELTKIYARDIIDRFNQLITPFFLRFMKFNILLYRLTGRYKGIAVNGKIDNVRKIKDSANIVYVSTYKTYSDFLLLLHSMNVKGLPFPRYFIDRRSIKKKWHEHLVRYTGGYIIDVQRLRNPVYSEVVCQYVSIMLKHGVPILHFPELRPSNDGLILNITDDFFTILTETLFRNTVEIVLVPVEISYSNRQVDHEKISMKQFREKVSINFSEPILLSEFTRESFREKTIPELVKDVWIEDSPVFSHSIVSRIIAENGYSISVKDAKEKTGQFIVSGKYFKGMKPEKIFKNGLAFLKKNRFVEESNAEIRCIQKEDIDYYSNMLSPKQR